MIRVEPFEPHHVDMIEVQPAQRDAVMPGVTYAAAGPAWTAFADDDRIIFCGGFAALGPGYMLAWALLSSDKRADLWPVTCAVRRVIAGAGWRRIELLTDTRFPAAERWALALGFEREGVRRSALADGGDLTVWTIIDTGALPGLCEVR